MPDTKPKKKRSSKRKKRSPRSKALAWVVDRDKDGEPSIVVANPGNIRVAVHRIVHAEGWFVSCYPLRVEMAKLEAEGLEEAKLEAVAVIADRLSGRIGEYEAALDELDDELKRAICTTS